MRGRVVVACVGVGFVLFAAWSMSSYASPAPRASPPVYQTLSVSQQTSALPQKVTYALGPALHTLGSPLHLPQSATVAKLSNAVRQHPQDALRVIHAYRARK